MSTSQIGFPSDLNWRQREYFKLIEEKLSGLSLLPPPIPTVSNALGLIEKSYQKGTTGGALCWRTIASAPVNGAGPKPPPLQWTVSDLVKAARLLEVPPQPVLYQDEHEMRLIFTLIYDVFRHKSIMAEILKEVGFYNIYPQLQEQCSQVWLLFYDLYQRNFAKREAKSALDIKQLFYQCGLDRIETALWEQRIHLAAALSRLRIEHSALQLDTLLPISLRNYQNNESQCPFSCWFNRQAIKSRSGSDNIEGKDPVEMIQRILSEVDTNLASCCQLDDYCPLLLNFDPTSYQKVTQWMGSASNTNGLLVFQNRSFCLGPALFARTLQELELEGSVVQTHLISPRSTAYLASLLVENPKIKVLLVFGAEDKKQEYEKYFAHLGLSVNKIRIFSESFSTIWENSTDGDSTFQNVSAIFATPPNTFTALLDPIDLICGRGGDMATLEDLTITSYDAKDLKNNKRISDCIQEQKNVLRLALSKPQVQLVLYETHSNIIAENEEVVTETIELLNLEAAKRQAFRLGKLPSLNESVDTSDLLKTGDSSSISFEELKELLRTVDVPDCDLFEQISLPLKLLQTSQKLIENGCYLALLQRKEITHFSSKFLIKVAEERGIIDIDSLTRSPKRRLQRYRKPATVANATKRHRQIELARISAPTHSYLRHTRPSDQIAICTCSLSGSSAQSKSASNEAQTIQKRVPAKKWWSETARHMKSLRFALENRSIVGKSSEETKLDEIVANSRRNLAIPIFPKLRLTRIPIATEREMVPLHATVLHYTSGSTTW